MNRLRPSRRFRWFALPMLVALAACATRPGPSDRRPCTAWTWIEDCEWPFLPVRNVLDGIAPPYELFLETDGTFAKYRRDNLVDWGWYSITCARTGNCGLDTIRFDSEEGIDWRLTMDDLYCDEPVRILPPPTHPPPEQPAPVVLPGDFPRDPLPEQGDAGQVRRKTPPRTVRTKEEPRAAEPDTVPPRRPVKKPPVRRKSGR